MKKKLLIGMAVIGASVTVLGGCGGSASTATTETTTAINATNETKSQETTTQSTTPAASNSNVSVELDENNRKKFEEFALSHSIIGEGDPIGFRLLEDWTVDDEYSDNIHSACWIISEMSENADINVQYNYEKIGDGSVSAVETAVEKIDWENKETGSTTVDGVNAVYYGGKSSETGNNGDFIYNEKKDGIFAYEVPLKDGELIVSLSCKYEDKDKYIDYLDMVTSSIDIPSSMKM